MVACSGSEFSEKTVALGKAIQLKAIITIKK